MKKEAYQDKLKKFREKNQQAQKELDSRVKVRGDELDFNEGFTDAPVFDFEAGYKQVEAISGKRMKKKGK